MHRADPLPPAFDRFDRIGGVVAFGVFDDADGSDDSIVAAIEEMLTPFGDVDAAMLRALGGRPMDRQQFLGDWHDPVTGTLIKRGDWRTASGAALRDPALPMLAGVVITGGGSPVPETGSGGQFAYAFSSPPYSLQASPGEVQALFDAILAFILPSDAVGEIRDWSSPRLSEVSRYFEAGMEWWGVFVFSIYLPGQRRLTIAMASTTD